MSKKIIISDREGLPSRRRTSPVRLETAENVGPEIVNERDPQPTAREMRAERRRIKSSARMNRDTTRQQRAMAKRSVSSTEFTSGDLVVQRRAPNIVGLVVRATGTVKEQGCIEVMCGSEILWWRAKGCMIVE